MKHTPNGLSAVVSSIPSAPSAPSSAPCDEVVEYDVPDSDRVLFVYHDASGAATWEIKCPRAANVDELHRLLLLYGRQWNAVSRRRGIKVMDDAIE